MRALEQCFILRGQERYVLTMIVAQQAVDAARSLIPAINEGH